MQIPYRAQENYSGYMLAVGGMETAAKEAKAHLKVN